MASEKLRTFDAFPKVHSSYSVKSSKGGFATIICGILCTFLAWVELASYFGGQQIQQFSVDKTIKQTLQVNLDITINMKCSTLHIAGLDNSEDRLVARELVTFEGAEKVPFERSWTMAENALGRDTFHAIFRRARRSRFRKHKNVENGPACRIYGSFNVNKVKGELYIVSTPMGGNFSHVIEELSFGEYYPKLVNPLDGVGSVSENLLEAYQYFISIVPTTYKSFSTGKTIVTNQYAVTEELGRKAYSSFMPPGIYFKYDFEPISLLITDRRMPFTQFLVRFVSILGGIVACVSWIYKAYDATASKMFKKEALRDSRPLLDKETTF